MSSQKLPLFGGLILPVHGSTPVPTTTRVFIPPDADSKAPITYELHLWVLGLVTGNVMAVAVTDQVSGKVGYAFTGVSASPNFFVPQKVLDGFPVRGNVRVDFQLVAADAWPTGVQLMGYYVPVGLGAVKEEERRAIGRPLTKNGAGVPFALCTPPVVAGFPADATPDAVIHTFDSGHIDEISLGMNTFLNTGGEIHLTFERKDNTPVIPGHYVRMFAFQKFGPSSFADAAAGTPYGLFPLSPYQIHKVPFGGFPDLHHLRATAIDFGAGPKQSAVSVHGYFVRK